MEQTVTIPLRPDRAPSALRIVGWLVALNFIMAIVSVMMIGVLSMLIGPEWVENPIYIILAIVGALVLIGLLFGAMYLVVRRRSRVAGALVLADEVRLLDENGEVSASVPRDAFQWRPVQLYDNDGSETYPVGPAIEITFPDRVVVTAFRNSTVRWGRDVASVMSTDWVCDEAPFHELLAALDVEDELVPY